MKAIVQSPLLCGVHYGTPAERYHHVSCTPDRALTAGLAIVLATCGPARAWVWENNKKIDKDIFEFGTAAHLMVLEPHMINDRVVIVAADNWRKQAVRDFRDEIRSAGKIPLLERNYEKIRLLGPAMRNELDMPFNTAPTYAAELLSGGHGEVTVIAGGGDIWMKIRPDYIKTGEDEDIIIDYKTTAFRQESIFKVATKHRWDIRAAFYLHVYAKVTGRRASYVYLVQETEWPHFVTAHIISSDDFARGAEDVANARRLFAECMRSGLWPSDVQDMRLISTSI